MSSGQEYDLQKIQQFAIERCTGNDPAHDSMHVTRVVANARAILADEPDAEPFITIAAAWLHDIVQLPKGSGEPGESARRSAVEAQFFLERLCIEQTAITAIAAAVETHSFSGGLQPASIEAAIVQDADRLDALGAIGIARLWATAAVLGSSLHHLDDPAAEQRALDDRTYGLDHIEKKLLKLPGLMNTNAGKRLALNRANYVDQHRTRFLEELAGVQ